MTTDYDALARKLYDQVVALGDGRTLATDAARADYMARHRELSAHIRGLRNDPADLARQEAIVAALEAQRDGVMAEMAAVEQEINTFVNPSTWPDARERDTERERQQQLRQRLRRLTEGSLYRSATETFPALADLDAQLIERRARVERLRASLAAHVAAAERLLGVSV